MATHHPQSMECHGPVGKYFQIMGMGTTEPLIWTPLNNNRIRTDYLLLKGCGKRLFPALTLPRMVRQAPGPAVNLTILFRSWNGRKKVADDLLAPSDSMLSLGWMVPFISPISHQP